MLILANGEAEYFLGSGSTGIRASRPSDNQPAVDVREGQQGRSFKVDYDKTDPPSTTCHGRRSLRANADASEQKLSSHDLVKAEE